MHRFLAVVGSPRLIAFRGSPLFLPPTREPLCLWHRREGNLAKTCSACRSLTNVRRVFAGDQPLAHRFVHSVGPAWVRNSQKRKKNPPDRRRMPAGFEVIGETTLPEFVWRN